MQRVISHQILLSRSRVDSGKMRLLLQYSVGCYKRSRVYTALQSQVLQRTLHYTPSKKVPESDPGLRSTSKNSWVRINITWTSALVSAAITAGMFFFYWNLEQEEQIKKSTERITGLADAGLGQLDWSLTDQKDKRRSYSEFRGRWLMLYFGFCHCPDICPEELEKLISVVSGIDQDSSTPDIQPIFITLDPERDTVEYMHKYCKDFSPKLIGFTGTTDEIAEVAKSYRVYYSLGEKDSDGDYIVDHTICMYIINPDGQLVDVYERRAKIDDIIQGSLKHMGEYHNIKRKLTAAKS